MAKTWVLDSETKGTGAHVAPLEGDGPRRRGERPLAVVQLERPPRPRREEPATAPSRRFKIVDVLGARVLGEDLGTRAAAAELARVASPLDVRVYLWEHERERWRLLNLAQTRQLWELARGEEPVAPGEGQPSTRWR
jgi:hypothetical protein